MNKHYIFSAKDTFVVLQKLIKQLCMSYTVLQKWHKHYRPVAGWNSSFSCHARFCSTTLCTMAQWGSLCPHSVPRCSGRGEGRGRWTIAACFTLPVLMGWNLPTQWEPACLLSLWIWRDLDCSVLTGSLPSPLLVQEAEPQGSVTLFCISWNHYMLSEQFCRAPAWGFSRGVSCLFVPVWVVHFSAVLCSTTYITLVHTHCLFWFFTLTLFDNSNDSCFWAYN